MLAGRTIDYQRARSLLLVAGLAILAGIALVMFVRRVDPVEVAATLFFLPVFVSFLYWGFRGGLVAALAAIAGYVTLRLPLIDIVGMEPFTGLIVTRSLGYLTFGTLGGWAVGQLRASLTKLDLYDHIDSETGLFNARYAIETIDLERSRAQRYEKIFSVVALERSSGRLDRRTREALMKRLGTLLESSVRTVDRVAHVADDGGDLFVFILPETAAEGAEIFARKVAAELAEVTGEPWAASTSTIPGDDVSLGGLMERLRSDVARDFPEATG